MLMLLLLLMLFGYNAFFDEKLRPEAAAYFANPPLNEPAPSENAAFAVLALQTRADGDIHTLGLAYWRDVELALSSGGKAPEQEKDLELPRLPSCAKQPRCLYWLQTQVDVAALVQRYHVLIERYRSLHRYPTLSSPRLPLRSLDAPLVAIRNSSLHKLWLLDYSAAGSVETPIRWMNWNPTCACGNSRPSTAPTCWAKWLHR